MAKLFWVLFLIVSDMMMNDSYEKSLSEGDLDFCLCGFSFVIAVASLTRGVVGAYDEHCKALRCKKYNYNTYDNRGCTLSSCQSNCCNSYNKSVGVCNHGRDPNSLRCDCKICKK
ncbi:hypothetical protein OROMI_024321 [Orobanche minor]